MHKSYISHIDRYFIIERSVHLVNGLLEIALAHRWLQTTIRCMELSQLLVQAMWINDNPLIQLPYITIDVLKAQQLEKKEEGGISVEVINLRSIRPLDVDTIVKSVKKTNRLISVDSGFPQYGFGSEICAIAMETEIFDYLDAPVERITDIPTPYAVNLEDLSFPNTKVIKKVVKRTLNRKK
ncbi:21839_t:CDS:2 [Entrophospora sp. SA101]|nr:21839_t:CDS:2 [Entrophospora sp. SA101]CAJ0823260.1 4058_t:CDS:2 [Entrophospora sp. SA101]